MTKRYGRNQRRAHRERIAELEKAAALALFRANKAERRLVTAREDAMREIVQSKPLVEEAMHRISHELGIAMGPHFVEAVEQLMAADQLNRAAAPIEFDVMARSPVDVPTTTVIEGRVKPLVYRVAFHPGFRA